jgi:GntR family transcriptional regulator/MocR family aminotransferase
LFGLPVLREAIAAYLRHTRGLVAPDHQVVITSGLTAGLRLVLEALQEPRVAMEHPAPPALWRPVRPIPLGSDIPDSCGVVVVSPDAHTVTGRIMPADRRRQLADWSAGTGGTIVELAGDNVVRPAACRLPRLVDLAPRTCVVGDFRDLLPVQLGYILVPSGLAGRIGPPDRPSHVLQAAAANLIADGVQLVHRARQLRARKHAIVESILPGLGGVLRLPMGIAATDVARELIGRGVRTETLTAYHFAPAPVPQALVLGYGHLPDHVLRKALLEVTEVLARVARERGGPVDLATCDGQVVRRAGQGDGTVHRGVQQLHRVGAGRADRPGDRRVSGHQ